jgi:hypothetical protein
VALPIAGSRFAWHATAAEDNSNYQAHNVADSVKSRRALARSGHSKAVS